MSSGTAKTIVNSWNEWDPLKHVIVGRADDCHIPPAEPALDAKVPEDSDMRGQWGPGMFCSRSVRKFLRRRCRIAVAGLNICATGR